MFSVWSAIVFSALFLHPITDTDSMQGHAAQIFFKVEILLNNAFKVTNRDFVRWIARINRLLRDSYFDSNLGIIIDKICVDFAA